MVQSDFNLGEQMKLNTDEFAQPQAAAVAAGVNPNGPLPDTDELRYLWTMQIVDKVDLKYQMAVQLEEFKKLTQAHALAEYSKII